MACLSPVPEVFYAFLLRESPYCRHVSAKFSQHKQVTQLLYLSKAAASCKVQEMLPAKGHEVPPALPREASPRLSLTEMRI